MYSYSCYLISLVLTTFRLASFLFVIFGVALSLQRLYLPGWDRNICISTRPLVSWARACVCMSVYVCCAPYRSCGIHYLSFSPSWGSCINSDVAVVDGDC